MNDMFQIAFLLLKHLWQQKLSFTPDHPVIPTHNLLIPFFNHYGALLYASIQFDFFLWHKAAVPTFFRWVRNLICSPPDRFSQIAVSGKDPQSGDFLIEGAAQFFLLARTQDKAVAVE